MKDKRSLLLILVCSILVLTWVYHLYDKSAYSKRTKKIYVKDTAAVAAAVSDSLKKIFSETLNGLTTEKLNADSTASNINSEPSMQISGIDSLRNDIDIILKRKNFTAADWNEARDKIAKLQSRIASLRSEDDSLSDIRMRLSNIATELNTELYSLKRRKQIISTDNITPAKNVSEMPTFVTTDIKFSASYIRSDQKVVETNRTDEAEKFVASFIVRNNATDLDNAEIIVVITNPSGKTLNPEVWDAGSFETKTEGRKVYTKRIRFEYKKAETKRLSYSMQPDQFEKGAYRLRLYHNGIKIGETTLKLD